MLRSRFFSARFERMLHQPVFARKIRQTGMKRNKLTSPELFQFISDFDIELIDFLYKLHVIGLVFITVFGPEFSKNVQNSFSHLFHQRWRHPDMRIYPANMNMVAVLFFLAVN